MYFLDIQELIGENLLGTEVGRKCGKFEITDSQEWPKNGFTEQ